MPYYHVQDLNFVEETVTENFISEMIDCREYQYGTLTVEWENYDGTNGAINIQISDNNVYWLDWGGAEGALENVDTSDDAQLWEFKVIPTS